MRSGRFLKGAVPSERSPTSSVLVAAGSNVGSVGSICRTATQWRQPLPPRRISAFFWAAVGRRHYQNPAPVRRDTPSWLYRVLQSSGAFPCSLAQPRTFPRGCRAGGACSGSRANAGSDDWSRDLAADCGGALRQTPRPDDCPAGRHCRRAQAASAEFTAMRRLAMRFRGLLRGGTAEGLDAWLIHARASGIYGMQRFAKTIRQDLEAVRNAMSEPWSNGQTEGQINKLKTLKRAMYGRAGVELLRARMMPL